MLAYDPLGEAVFAALSQKGPESEGSNSYSVTSLQRIPDGVSEKSVKGLVGASWEHHHEVHETNQEEMKSKALESVSELQTTKSSSEKLKSLNSMRNDTR